MAKSKYDRSKKSLDKHDYQTWIRTGGAVGDDSMKEQHDFNRTGAGVVEVLKEAPQEGADPNADATPLPKQKGAE